MSAAAVHRRFAEIAAQVGRPAIGPPPNPYPVWLSTGDLAELLRLGTRRRPREAARDWAIRHGLVSVLVNREHRFSRRDVEHVLEASMTQGRRRSA